jgi:hypothetical protein
MNRPRLEALQMLKRARSGEVELSPEQWFDLTLMETGDRDLAEHARNDYIRAVYRAKSMRGE